jgi:chromosome segregation protein
MGQIQQKRVALRDKTANIQMQIRQCEHSISTLQNDLKNAQSNYDGSQRMILAAESRISELFMSRQEYQETNKVLTVRRNEYQQENEKLMEQVRQLRARKEAKQELLHELEMRMNEDQLRMENLSQRAIDEIGLDLEEGYQNYEHEQRDWEAIRTEIEDLKQKIERLGNVNLDAITEQEELEQRAGHLNQELEDLNTAKKQLEQLIERINKESTDLFQKNFDAIRENFSDLFRKLFGGGRAEIVLEDPENVLECGIEIIARPPGKQLQSITLMSGGEKTMTAVALLMAIFKSKPSPFCLMDEVDAALDEANNERFNLVVQEFLETSQFVVITHSRRTMAIADTIYGVTMQEQGVSKKVSVRFSGNDDLVEETGNAVA